MRIKLSILIILVNGFSIASPVPEPALPVATNSVAFHLQTLELAPTKEELEVIEAAISIMQRHHFIQSYPLRSIFRDEAAKEWVLEFDNRHPDCGYEVFLRDKHAEWFEYRRTLLASRERFPRLCFVPAAVRVVDSATTNAVAGAMVYTHCFLCGTPYATNSYRTDSNGIARIGAFEHYDLLRVTMNGYEEAALLFDLTNGVFTNVELSLKRVLK